MVRILDTDEARVVGRALERDDLVVAEDVVAGCRQARRREREQIDRIREVDRVDPYRERDAELWTAARPSCASAVAIAFGTGGDVFRNGALAHQQPAWKGAWLRNPAGRPADFGAGHRRPLLARSPVKPVRGVFCAERGDGNPLAGGNG